MTRPPRSLLARIAPWLAIFAVLGLAIGWWLGIVQEFLRFLLNYPGATVALIGVVVLPIGFTMHRRRTVYYGLGLIGIGGLIGVLYLVRLSAWAGTFDRELGSATTPPDSTFLPRRVLPHFVAGEFARRTLTDARYRLGSLEPTMTQAGRLVWQAPLIPNSLGTYFTRGVREIVEVDADTTRPTVRRTVIDLPKGGEGNFASFVRLIARTIAPLSRTADPVYDTDARAALVPLVRWVWGMPSYHAVIRFDSLGGIDRLTPGEAAEQHPHLRLVPEELVYWKASRWGEWRRGLLGSISKRGLLKIAMVAGVQAPTLLDNDQRGSWVVPMEAQGRSFGLAGVLFIDARTGAAAWWDTQAQSLPSPSQALRIAVDDPRIALLKNAIPAEPKFGVLDGRVHYLVPIMPASGSQVQRLVVVDAASSRAVIGEHYADVWAQVRSGAEVPPAVASAEAGSAPSEVLARLNAMASTVAALQAQLDSLRVIVD